MTRLFFYFIYYFILLIFILFYLLLYFSPFSLTLQTRNLYRFSEQFQAQQPTEDQGLAIVYKSHVHLSADKSKPSSSQFGVI